MPTQVMSNTPKPTSEDKTGLEDTKPLELNPWDIADLLICKRLEQPISIEFATDNEFDTWVKMNSIRVKENGITGWTFDDRCRLVNYVLAHRGILEFVDGSILPKNSDNSVGE
jgi:hypothetical protein